MQAICSLRTLHSVAGASMNEQGRKYTPRRTSNSRSVAAGVRAKYTWALVAERRPQLQLACSAEVVEKDEPRSGRAAGALNVAMHGVARGVIRQCSVVAAPRV
jgi:hypothetical protein